MTKVFKNITLFLVAASLLVSCEAYNNSNNTQRGAVIGAAGGAILGAILGNNVGSGGNSELGAVIGTTVGGAAGAVIGNQMDRQAKKIEEVVCEQKRLRAHACGGERGFRACVSAADDDDVVGFGVNHVGHVFQRA